MSEMPTALQRQVADLENARVADEAPEAPVSPVPEDRSTPTEAAPETPVEPKPVQQPSGSQVLGNTTPAPQDGEPSQDWEQKYRVVNGKYVAETGRLRTENKGLQARVAALGAEVEALKKAAPPATPLEPQGGQKGKPVDASSISDEDVRAYVNGAMIDEFGMDYWKQSLAISRSVMASQQPVGTNDEGRIEQVERRVENQARNTFYSELTTLRSDWEEINNSKEWEAFLRQVDPLSGVSYETLVIDAYEQYDSVRVSRLMEAFKDLHKGEGEKKPNPVAGQEVPRPGPATPPTKPSGVTMSLDQWNQEMNSLPTAGLTPTQMVHRQEELLAAYREGRVTDIPADRGSPESFV